jgi:hypothetical protein
MTAVHGKPYKYSEGLGVAFKAIIKRMLLGECA